MHWIIESHLLNKSNSKELLDNLISKNIAFSIVNLSENKKEILSYSFSSELSPMGFIGNNYIVLGSHDLVLIALEKKWEPGAFLNDNFNYYKLNQYWGNYLLNNDAKIRKISDVIAFTDDLFIRPIDDSKKFDGKMFSFNEFSQLRENLDEKNLNDEIVLAKPKDIISEYRAFIVGGKYITASLYKKNEKPFISPIVPNEMIHFINELLQFWTPAQGFSLDIALTKGGYKVIEINCLNSSAFYANDMNKVVIAIENLIENTKN